MTSQPTQPRVVAQDLLHTGRKFNFVCLRIAAAGRPELAREIVRHPGAVVIVPVRDDGTIVLIQTFRPSVGKELVECCAGTIERTRTTDGNFGTGEAPEACAARELVEETGYQASVLTPLGGPGGWFYTSPGLSDEQMFAFKATGLTHVGQKLEEDEHIRVITVSPQEALSMIADGRMRDAKSMLAILLALGQRPAHST